MGESAISRGIEHTDINSHLITLEDIFSNLDNATNDQARTEAFQLIKDLEILDKGKYDEYTRKYNEMFGSGGSGFNVDHRV